MISSEPKGGDDSRKLWKDVAGLIRRVLNVERMLADLLAQVALFRKNKGDSTAGNFPFRIYRALPLQLPDGADATAAWRTFLVRGGRVEAIVLRGDGTDGYDDDPDGDLMPAVKAGSPEVPVKPVVVPADEDAYWFWIELTKDDGPQLRHGSDPTSDAASVNDWESFPAGDGLHIPIGFVDTATTPGQAVVRQLLRADVLPSVQLAACDPVTGDRVVYHLQGTKEPPEVDS